MKRKRTPSDSGLDDSSSEDERARLKACESICVPDMFLQPKSESKASTSKKTNRNKKQGERRGIDYDKDDDDDDDDDQKETKQTNQIAKLLNQHLDSQIEFPPEDSIVPALPSGNVQINNASIHSQGAVKFFRLFHDSKQGLINGEDVKKTAKRAYVDNDENEEEEERKHLDRLKSVVVASPLKPFRTRDHRTIGVVINGEDHTSRRGKKVVRKINQKGSMMRVGIPTSL